MLRTMADPTELRASDADRERTVVRLRRHATEGRLTMDELDERCERAYAARTVGDLAALVADLPRGVARVAAPRPATPALDAGGIGVRPFTYVWDLPVAPEKALAEALRHIAPTLNRQRYELVERTPGSLVFSYRYRPGWVWVTVVCLPLFGLLALMYRVEERITIELEPGADGGSRMTIRGQAPRSVRRAFVEMLR
jgi:hypothetical protein